MTTRTGADAPHGWLVVDKPVGVSSAAVVGRLKRAFRAGKAGHGGTLDPLASGVLAVALGEATKTVGFILDGRKAYRFAVRWGEARATDDAEGEVVARSPLRPAAAAIRAALPGFVGEIEQRPPAYSAIKLGGERAYALARAGRSPELASRTVVVEKLELVGLPDADTAEFEVACGKGMYVRSLARDLAEALGTVGHVCALRRLRAGPFALEQAISLEKLEGVGHSAAAGVLLPVEAALVDIPALALDGKEAERLRNGQSVPVQQAAAGLRLARTGDVLVALVEIAGGEARPTRVFNLPGRCLNPNA